MISKMLRFEWLAKTINDSGFGYIAELGVRNCVTSKHLLANCPSIKFFLLVDLWQEQPGNEGPEDYVGTPHKRNYNIAKKLEEEYQSVVVCKKSTIDASFVNWPSFDLVFVDADHSYDAVKRDIWAWKPKIKKGGILCGHDYHWDTVKKAVNEEFTKVEHGTRNDSMWWTSC